jgi:hypothetical protein
MCMMMSWRRAKKIETLEEFLDAMYTSQWNVSSELRWSKGHDWNPPHVYVYHDRNYYTDAESFPVSLSVVEEALQKGLIQGKPEWGYTSKTEWRISDEGKKLAREQAKMRMVLEAPIKVNYDHDGEG